jgi:hypothetical protein
MNWLTPWDFYQDSLPGDGLEEEMQKVQIYPDLLPFTTHLSPLTSHLSPLTSSPLTLHPSLFTSHHLIREQLIWQTT